MKTLDRFLIRHASGRDATRIAGIQIRSCQAACKGLVPETKLQEMDASRRAVEWKDALGTPCQQTVLVAMKGNRMAGFCTFSESTDPEAAPATAEIGSFFVDPLAWGRGAGRDLAEEVMGQAKRRGFSQITQWVIGANDRSRRFCESIGFAPDGVVKTEDISGCPVQELRYARRL
ncbi:GNAT family N-acetyltransferase [Luteolibacter flavescens]|uniref:GNAT family N-acetyltransferase n=1 Tax=Luteolibacter flavescens TaxID=1859460 RepID=A0ABT3FQU6_9BACT|nr:GNAT family N-acetyltransferase [Luteolibacter flavescens]MCW1885935.1 GNAT family N-acetyltransferase [Luteolibacter flavescens]